MSSHKSTAHAVWRYAKHCLSTLENTRAKPPITGERSCQVPSSMSSVSTCSFSALWLHHLLFSQLLLACTDIFACVLSNPVWWKIWMSFICNMSAVICMLMRTQRQLYSLWQVCVVYPLRCFAKPCILYMYFCYKFNSTVESFYTILLWINFMVRSIQKPILWFCYTKISLLSNKHGMAFLCFCAILYSFLLTLILNRIDDCMCYYLQDLSVKISFT